MFLLTLVIINTADTKRQLENNVLQAQSIAQAMNCSLIRLDFQQENALVASLPLCQNPLNLCRGLTTSSFAIFVPFTTQELFQTGSEALYYGVNAMSSNLIMIDRKLLKNPNGLILGVPGSGKSFSAKREITNVFLVTNDDILICDPEAEYAPLVERLHGQVIHISPTSTDYINPLDLSMDYSDEENPLSLKSDFVLSLCELIVGGKDGLQPVEKTIIDRCVRHLYQDYLANPLPENMPILEDLYNLLCAQHEAEAHYLATALEIYVTGSLNIFNHRTNVNIHGNLKATQGDTGHAEIDMLTKVYAHILDSDRKITAQRFEEAFYQSQDLPEQKDNSSSSPNIAALIAQIQQYPELGKILSDVLAKQASTDENTENGIRYNKLRKKKKT